MADYNSQYTGEQVDSAVRNSTKVVANPDISGTTPASLTSLEVAGTKYKVATDITVDSALSSTSENPVQNKVINSALTGKQSTIDSSHKLSSDLVDDTSSTNKFVTASEKTTWNGKSTVSVSNTGTATDEISYITIDGTEKKIAGGGGGVSVNQFGITTTWAQIYSLSSFYEENTHASSNNCIAFVDSGIYVNVAQILDVLTDEDSPLIDVLYTHDEGYDHLDVGVFVSYDSDTEQETFVYTGSYEWDGDHWWGSGSTEDVVMIQQINLVCKIWDSANDHYPVCYLLVDPQAVANCLTGES